MTGHSTPSRPERAPVVPVPRWWRGQEPDPGRVRELYTVEGLTEREIAAQLGISRDRVAAVMAAEGIRRRSRKLPCPLSVDQLGEVVRGGATTGSLARQMGVSADTARRWLADAGLLPPDPDIAPDLLARLYLQEQVTTRELATRLGVTKARALHALAAAGIRTRPRTVRPPTGAKAAVTDDALRAVYSQPGMTIAAAAAHFGVNAEYLRRRVHAMGLVKRRGTFTPHLPAAVAQDLRDQAPALYQAGWSMHQVAEQLGVSTNSVQRALHHAQVPIRRSGPRRASTNRGTADTANTETDRAEPLLGALYTDPDVVAVLDRHGVHRPGSDVAAADRWRPAGPFESYAPLPLSEQLLTDLYIGVGLAMHHMEMLLGVGVDTVRAELTAAGIRTRPTRQPSPWTTRRHTDPHP